ncbi:MAG TPA: excinuclease ABC subunit UvrB [Candidatus Deferrimicrobium sp.]|nr:excinuclease ABC subunit UvrB [Candidatus Deferrimicrobium sp.]
MFKLNADFNITAEQSRVVDAIVNNYKKNIQRQVLLGVTGSGKTFTMANIVCRLNLPTLVLSPNKTLAAQLYQEFKGFFPENRVGYFISYYDYYQPEAYIPQRHLYIAKEVSINPELERLRIDATRNVLESPFTVVVASVSAIYSIGSPDDFFKQKITYSCRSNVDRDTLVKEFVNLGYSRTEGLMESGKFRIRGDIVELFPTSEENPIRFVLQDDKIIAIDIFDAVNAAVLSSLQTVSIFPVSYFHYEKSRTYNIVQAIKEELEERIAYFIAGDQIEYAERLKERILFDLELLTQYGHCPGIENYSLYLTGRKKGEAPYTLLDFFKGDYLTIIDESHISLPQLRGMYRGDRSRKETLVRFGFRLPSALDNRPLNFEEINRNFKKVLYVSATPTQYEIDDAGRHVTDLLVRPTGLLDPEIELRNSDSPVEDMVVEINKEVAGKNRVLVTTLTKKMAEKLTDYLAEKQIKATYMHSEIKTLDRIKIIKKLRTGEVDVLVGINLLREGLDLPEVSLVIILDADREGFLRSETSLIQTFGRASRNIHGRVILYMKEMTDSMRRALSETQRRRKYQEQFNKKHNITPTAITKQIKDFYDDDYWIKKSEEEIAVNFKSRESLESEIVKLTKKMKEKAANLDFKGAAILRDRVKELKNLLVEMY